MKAQLSADKLLMMLDSISDGVFTVDMERRITFFNRAAENITKVSREKAFGEICSEILRPAVDCETTCVMEETLATGKPVSNRTICILNSEGKRVPISVSTSLLKDERGQIIGGVETFRDLSLVESLRRKLELNYTFHDIISRNERMLRIFKVLPIIAESESTVLIEGESGTGKELVARAIHALSTRKNGPMISVNCGALPDTLLESELFGYKAGAFTDAKHDKKGRFALAAGGTLFLDEIGDISPALQVRLLRVLQEKVYEPLGATKPESADVRIIAATNRPLAELVTENRFRSDLYYRINILSVQLPPLRERLEDIPLLADHFIREYVQHNTKEVNGLTPPAMRVLMNHSYPGNVRELSNIIEHACVLCQGGPIRPEHFPEYLQKTQTSIPAVEIASNFNELEGMFLIAVLKKNRFNRTRTAAELGIHPSTLYRKLKKLGLKPPRRNSE